ncbi:helix-turn-helix domain-containing protein [Blastopirellula marina]|uniref:Resolvase HTH domain-containing protein n=1 Tax=Blastopirellula marina TaxID=124 RepID=A0A2S8F985_9BACT|nr:helix-turn-helix domain-containing protein [Blastopirellula marina]PQO28728.1 hypothetical protein C5Y98_23375 [Blastopirellula marina]
MPRRSTPRRNRIEPSQISEIHRLRAAGRTQVEIQRITGISRTTIHRILNKDSADNESSPTDNDAINYFDGPIERCPRCGRKVHMPCMPCRVDSMMASGQVRQTEIQETDRRQAAKDW